VSVTDTQSESDRFDLAYPRRGIEGGQRRSGNVPRMTRKDLLMLRWQYIAPNPIQLTEQQTERLLTSTSRNLTLIKAEVIKLGFRRDTEAELLCDLINWAQDLQEKVDALSSAPTVNFRMR